MPAIIGLTKLVTENLLASLDHKDHIEAILKRFADDAQPGTATIEDILSHIRALQDVVKGGTIDGLDRAALDALDNRICEITTQVVGATLPGSDTPYHKLAKWIGGTSRPHPVEIFTSNYDLLIEQALEAERVPYFDGFVGSKEAFFDLTSMDEDLGVPARCLPVRWSRLWKLHGSINWWGRYQGEDKKFLRVIRSGTEKPVGADRQMIYPSHLKYDESRRLPYLAMLDRLKNFLGRGQAVLVTCGYRFGDKHLNEVIFEGLRSNPTAVCFGLLHGPRSNYASELIKEQRHANLSLLASDGAVLGTLDRAWHGDANSTHLMHGLSVDLKHLETEGAVAAPPCEFLLGNFRHFGRFLEQQLSRFEDHNGNDGKASAGA